MGGNQRNNQLVAQFHHASPGDRRVDRMYGSCTASARPSVAPSLSHESDSSRGARQPIRPISCRPYNTLGRLESVWMHAGGVRTGTRNPCCSNPLRAQAYECRRSFLMSPVLGPGLSLPMQCTLPRPPSARLSRPNRSRYSSSPGRDRGRRSASSSASASLYRSMA